MIAPNNDLFVMKKPNVLSMGPAKKKSSQLMSNITIDFCSFLGLGLGFEKKFLFSNYASVILMDIDENENYTLLEDDEMEGDLSTLFGDTITLDIPSQETKDKNIINQEDQKTKYSTPTISNLTMETFLEGINVKFNEQQQGLPSRLVFHGKLVAEERSFSGDEEDSKTLNTLSTSRITPSSDTNTVQLTPSLNTKSWNANLAGLELVETTLEDTTEVDIRRNCRNDSLAQHNHLDQVKRVPSTINIFDKDDQSSIVSIISDEEDFPGKGNGTTSEIEGIYSTKGHRNTRRLFGVRRKLRRAWPWNKKLIQTTANKSGLQPVSTKRVMRTLTSTLKTSPDSSRATIPSIEPVKLIDVTTTTIDKNKDRSYFINYLKNVPFDEPIACPPPDN